MGLPTRPPLDPFPYARDPTSQPAHVGLAPGNYVYVMDDGGVLWVTQDALHQHPKVLGGAKAAAAAGELTIETPGVVSLVNNLSGTFQLPSCATDNGCNKWGRS